jgi:hypothetical protein
MGIRLPLALVLVLTLVQWAVTEGSVTHSVSTEAEMRTAIDSGVKIFAGAAWGGS